MRKRKSPTRRGPRTSWCANEDGEVLRVTEAMAKAKLGQHEEIIEVWEKDPNVQAFTDLMSRALDKPKEQEQEIKLTGSEDLIAKQHAARARMATARHGEAML